MQCPICAALNREHGHECEVEARATIQQRAELAAWHTGDISKQDQLDQEILSSRKRQAHIAFELYEHQTAKHPVVKMLRVAAG